MGDWDLTSNEMEPIPYVEYDVAAIFSHEMFNPINSKNNIAVVRLAQAVNLGEVPTITTACLPSKYYKIA